MVLSQALKFFLYSRTTSSLNIVHLAVVRGARLSSFTMSVQTAHFPNTQLGGPGELLASLSILPSWSSEALAYTKSILAFNHSTNSETEAAYDSLRKLARQEHNKRSVCFDQVRPSNNCQLLVSPSFGEIAVIEAQKAFQRSFFRRSRTTELTLNPSQGSQSIPA